MIIIFIGVLLFFLLLYDDIILRNSRYAGQAAGHRLGSHRHTHAVQPHRARSIVNGGGDGVVFSSRPSPLADDSSDTAALLHRCPPRYTPVMLRKHCGNVSCNIIFHSVFLYASTCATNNGVQQSCLQNPIFIRISASTFVIRYRPFGPNRETQSQKTGSQKNVV